MDYTPLTFSAAYRIHRIPYAHSLALSVVFECGVQHWADRADSNPHEGYRKLFADFPFVREFLRVLPTVWDDTVLISGHPSIQVTLARRHGEDWWVATAAATTKFPTTFNHALSFMGEDNLFEYQAIMEGKDAESLVESKGVYTTKLNGTFYARVLPQSGFVAHFRYLKKVSLPVSSLVDNTASSISFFSLSGDGGIGVTFKLLLLFLAVAALVYFSKAERRRKLRRSLAKKFF